MARLKIWNTMEGPFSEYEYLKHTIIVRFMVGEFKEKVI